MAHKIYLSHSDQHHNTYAVGDTNEAEQMERVAKATEKALLRCGFEVLCETGISMQQRVINSNKWGAELHVPIHSNGSVMHNVSGTRMFYWDKQGAGYRACLCIFNRLAPLTPGTSENIRQNQSLYEMRVPYCPSVYIETEFHDVPETAQWIIDHVQDIGEAITQGICDYFGVQYVLPDNKLYRIQLGAFKSLDNASKFLEDVRKNYSDAFIVEV